MTGGRCCDKRSRLTPGASLVSALELIYFVLGHKSDPGPVGRPVRRRMPRQGGWLLISSSGMEAEMSAIGRKGVGVVRRSDLTLGPVRRYTPYVKRGKVRKWSERSR